MTRDVALRHASLVQLLANLSVSERRKLLAAAGHQECFFFVIPSFYYSLKNSRFISLIERQKVKCQLSRRTDSTNYRLVLTDNVCNSSKAYSTVIGWGVYLGGAIAEVLKKWDGGSGGVNPRKFF